MSIFMRSSLKPGRCKITSSLPGRFWKLPYLPPWQHIWEAGGETAVRGWWLPSPSLLAAWWWDFPGLHSCWASWLASGPWECARESKWIASLLCEVLGTSRFSPAGETQIPIFIHFPSLLESNLIEACFLLRCFLSFLIQISQGTKRTVSIYPLNNNFL